MQELTVDQSDSAVIAAFTIAVERVLGETPTVEAVRRLIYDIREACVAAASLQPVRAEAVVREDSLLEGISYGEMIRLKLSITKFKVVSIRI